MKKKSFSNLKFGNSLSREELSNILGGSASISASACSAVCLDAEGGEYTVTCDGDTCESSDFSGCSGTGPNGSTHECDFAWWDF